MDFSSVSSLEPVDSGVRARARWNTKGMRKFLRGPRRVCEEAAQQDLDSMREDAKGLSREGGFAAMQAEARRLVDSKAPKAAGFVTLLRNSFAARVRWKEAGEMRVIYGPRRAEQRRAEMDLESMRTSQAVHKDTAVRRDSLAATSRRLQQQAEHEG